MRKRKYTEQVGVLFSEEIYKLLIEITDEKEVSISAYIREIVEKKLREEK